MEGEESKSKVMAAAQHVRGLEPNPGLPGRVWRYEVSGLISINEVNEFMCG